jgi:hypothetical protein
MEEAFARHINHLRQMGLLAPNANPGLANHINHLREMGLLANNANPGLLTLSCLVVPFGTKVENFFFLKVYGICS